MSSTPDEPLPLPEADPITGPDVKAWLKLTSTDNDSTLEEIAAAVSLFVRGLAVADKARGEDNWPATIRLGAKMLAARLHRRRDNPEGVAAFGDLGVVYVRRNDPDVAFLLELGDESRPAVG